MKFDVSKKPIAAFSFSSLTDIVLLLLIFFLLTSQFVINNGVQINLPKTSNLEKSNVSPLIISINKKSEIFIKGRKVQISELENKLKKVYKKKTNNNILIQADKDVSLEIVIKVIDIAKGVGIEKFTIQTEKE